MLLCARSDSRHDLPSHWSTKQNDVHSASVESQTAGSRHDVTFAHAQAHLSDTTSSEYSRQSYEPTPIKPLRDGPRTILASVPQLIDQTSTPPRVDAHPQSLETLPAPELLDRPADGAEDLRRGILIRAARNAVALQDYPAAIAQFATLLSEYPDFQEARFEYAGILILSGETEAARQELEQLVAQDPSNIDYQSEYVDLLLSLAEHELAEESLLSIIDSGQATAHEYILLARVLAWQGRFPEALELYNQYREQWADEQAGGDLVSLLLELHRPAEALAMIGRLRADGITGSQMVIDEILATARLGKTDEAITMIGQLSETPELAHAARIELADALYREQEFSCALLLYQQCAESNFEDIPCVAKLVRTQLRLFDVPSAEAVLAQVAAPSPRLIRLQQANLCTITGEHAKAYAIYGELLANNPSDPDALKGLGTLLFSINDFEQASATLRHAMTLAPRDRETARMLAASLAKQLRIDEAVMILSSDSTANATGPAAVPQAGSLAEILTISGDPAEAEAACREALASTFSDKTRAMLTTQLAIALMKQDRNAEAIETFENARAIPGGGSAKLTYGHYSSLVQVGRINDAESELNADLTSSDAPIYDRIVIADLAMRDCRCNLAALLLEEALNYSPNNAAVQIRLAEARSMCAQRCDGCADEPEFVNLLTRSPTNTRALLVVRQHQKLGLV